MLRLRVRSHTALTHEPSGGPIEKIEKLIETMYFDESVKDFLSSPRNAVFNRARAKLVSIAGEALSRVSGDNRYDLPLSDPAVENYFFTMPGCMQILFAMGFEVRD